MSTSLHSEKNLMLFSRHAMTRVHVLAMHRVPVALTLSAIVLSVLGVRA
ncbi:hypothetical protein ACSFA3_07835 [Variovorax sp. RHLX14]